MDIQALLKGVDCNCGKKHTCDMKYCYIEENACKRLTDLCKGYKKILIVADENTFKASGENVINAIDKPYEKIIDMRCSIAMCNLSGPGRWAFQKPSL